MAGFGGEYYTPTMPAVQCEDCGRMYPADPNWREAQIQAANAMTVRPAASPPSLPPSTR